MTATRSADGHAIVVDVRTSTLLPTTELPVRPVVRPSLVDRASPASVTITTVAVVAALAAWFLVYAFVVTAFQEHGSQTRLYDRFRLQLSAATAPLGGVIKSGSPVALLSAPEAGLHDLVVVEGTTSGLLRSGPGHLSNTPLPGQAGASVILGRSVMFGAPFGHLLRLKAGDRIQVITGQGSFTYQVQDTRRPGDLLPKPLQANQSMLTLVTSTGSGWRSGWSPTRPAFVDSLLVHGTVQAAPAGASTTVSSASLPMQGDSKALVPLIFWLEGLLLVSAVLIWSWRRWGRLQTWVAGLPILLAVLWGTSGAVVQFLPNLI